MRVHEGFRDISNPDEPGFIDIELTDLPDYLIYDILRMDPDNDHTRSQGLAFRLPNGDLIIGFYPHGDTYEYITQYWSV